MPEIRTTTCNRDCPDACTIAVTVEGGRATRLAGDRQDPITQGFLCERTNRFLFRQYSPDRFTSPMLRRGGRLEPISWDAALDLVAAKFTEIRDQDGGAAILHYRSGGSLGILKSLSDHLFAHFGPVTTKRGDVCSGAGEWAQEQDFGVSESHDVFDLLESRSILIWGKNPHTSGPHLLPILDRARKNGAVLAGIDPIRTKAAQICDHFIQPRPGGDFDLAMGVARRLFDTDGIVAEASSFENSEGFERLAHANDVATWARRADVTERDVHLLADLLRVTRPANIQIGWGMARRRNGAAIVRALDALAAITGNIGVKGGGATFYYGRRRAFDYGFMADDPKPPRTFEETLLGREIIDAKDPKIRAIWITAGNPVTMLPDSRTVARALASSEFTVVVDTHPTDTTDLAHLVLPVPTLLEDDDLMGAYGNHWIRESRPAITAPDGVRHELEIWQGFAQRVGLGSLLDGTVESWKRRLLSRLSSRGVSLEALREGPKRNPFVADVAFEGGRTDRSNGRIALMDSPPIDAAVPDRDFPLLLMAISTPKAQSSQWSHALDGSPCPCRVHPASAFGFGDGSTARLESRVGSLTVRVVHDPSVRPDVALLPKGGMLRQGWCANALIEARTTDNGGGAAYYDQPVRLC